MRLSFFDVSGVFPFGTFADFEGDFVPFIQAFVAISSDIAEVDEKIFSAIFTADKAVALGVVEPFYGSLLFIGHKCPPYILRFQWYR